MNGASVMALRSVMGVCERVGRWLCVGLGLLRLAVTSGVEDRHGCIVAWQG